jgi:hypothetical protein
MKSSALITILVMFSLTACDKKSDEKPVVMAPAIVPGTPLPPGHPAINAADPTLTLSDAPDVVQSQQATVLSSIDIPQFTYLEVKQNNQTRWLATSTLAVKKGDVIQFDIGSTMTNFKSNSLNRTFPSITFVNRATVTNGK